MKRSSRPNPSRPSQTASIFLGLAIGLVSALPVSGQTAIPGNSPITQNFDSIGATQTANLPSGWKMSVAGAGSTAGWATGTNVTAVTQQASSGAPATGGRYNWGQSTSDRAIGFMTSGSYASPNSIMAHYQNTSGLPITDLAITFDIERYRINTSAANVTFFTSTDGSAWTARTAGDTGPFSTGASAYTFTGGTVVPKTVTLTGLSIENGSSIYLRWVFDTTGSSSQGLGLDNVSVTATLGADTIPPVILSRSPDVAATNVLISSGVSITFNETVQLGAGAIQLYQEAGETDVLVPIGTVNVAVNTVSFAPTSPLIPGQTYYVLIAGDAITDTAPAPNAFPGISDPTTWTFTTDGTAPTLTTPSPANGATNIPTSSDLVATFSETIVAGTGDLVIRAVSDNSALFTIPVTDSQITISGNTLTINPSTNLPSGTAVYVEIPATAIIDTSTNAFAGISGSAVWSFTTDGTAPAVNTFAPANSSTLASVGANLVAAFNEPILAGTGDVVVRRVSDNSALFTIPVTDSQVNVSGSTLTINPTADLPFGTAVYVEIAATAITDTSGNAFPGITGSGTWSFTTYPAPTVVVNKVGNTTGDRVELLVVGTQVPGSTLDMRGMILKDFSNNGNDDTGGKITFANTTFWSAIPVGTLIVLQASTSTSPDTDASDFVLSLGLTNTTYFTSTGSFDMGSNDSVMIKEAGSGISGNTGGIHAFGVGSAGSFFTGFTGPKLRTTTSAGTNQASVANNPTSALADFNGTAVTAAIPIGDVAFGLPNNSTNSAYIFSLRGINPGVATIVNPTSPFTGLNIFPANTAATTVQLTLDAQIPNTTVTGAIVTVPAAFGTPAGVTLSGPGAGTGTAGIAGQVITVSGVEVTNTNAITLAISGLTSPVTTASDTGSFIFTVQTSISGGPPADIPSPVARVIIPIEAIRDNDANGLPVDSGAVVAIEGVCTEAQFYTSNTVAQLQNGNQAMTIFNATPTGNPFVRGKRYALVGTVGHFSGQTQVILSSFANVIDLGADTEPTPTDVTIPQLLDTPEDFEGRLVRILNVSRDPSDTDTWAANASITIQDTASPTPNTLPVFIASGSGALTNPTASFNITGIFSQFDTTSPHSEGYRIMPREENDIGAIPTGSGYDLWIDGFYPGETNPLIIGQNADPDKDGRSNLVEAYTGGKPNVAEGSPFSGMTKSGNTFVFYIQKAKTEVPGLTGSYEWSTGLGTWNASAATEGGVTVTIAESLSENSHPDYDLYEVTATAAPAAPDELFVRLVVED